MPEADHPAMLWTRAQLAATKPPSKPRPRPSAIVSDSREATPGSVFVALRGPNADGHRFVAQAVAHGAAAVVAEQCTPLPALSATVAVQRVPSTQQAYLRLASAWRRELGYRVVGIVGSVGKTTVKDLLAAMLEAAYPTQVIATRGSQNGRDGVPATLLRAREEHRFAVVEHGIDAPDQMADLVAISQPDAMLLTAIASEHLAQLGSIEGVRREQFVALQAVAQRHGLIVAPRDELHAFSAQDQTTTPHPPHTGQGFTLIDGVAANDDGSTSARDQRPDTAWHGVWQEDAGTLHLPAQKVALPLPSAFVAQHHARNALAAVAMARLLGVDWTAIRQGLADFRMPTGRGELLPGVNGSWLWCDHFNASPAAMQSALSTVEALRRLKPQRFDGKLILCLGDMLDLGEASQGAHRKLAEAIDRSKPDATHLVGEAILNTHRRLATLGVPSKHWHNKTQLAEQLRSTLRAGDLVLIKASRGLAFETIVAALGPAI